MGKDLFDRHERARLRYDEAADILSLNLARVCFEGPEDELRNTRVTQPALYVHSCILTELLAECGLSADAAAGHSLGEYSALFAASTFSFTEGLKLVRARAEAMQLAGEQNPGTMAAVVGLEDVVVQELCSEASSHGVVIPANYNSPGQIVVSGTVSGVRTLVEMAKRRGARLAKELVVSGAFHSPLMQPAADKLTAALQEADIRAPRIPVVSNATAIPHGDANSVRELLAKQLLSPVRWAESQAVLSSLGATRWYEVGSGNVLAGLLKRSVPGSSAICIGTADDLDRVTAAETVGN